MLKVSIIFTFDRFKHIPVYCSIYIFRVVIQCFPAALWYSVTTFFEIQKQKVFNISQKIFVLILKEPMQVFPLPTSHTPPLHCLCVGIREKFSACYCVYFSRPVLDFFSLAVQWFTKIILGQFPRGLSLFPQLSLFSSLAVKNETEPQICYPQASHPLCSFLVRLIVSCGFPQK